jgi:Tol biopolymer transport system component
MHRSRVAVLCGCTFWLAAGLAQVQVSPILALEGETSAPSLSPDGKMLAFQWCKSDYSCGIYTRPLAGGTVQLLVAKDAKEGTASDPHWSPDGKRIAFTRFYSRFDSHLFVADSRGKAERDLGLICDLAPEGVWTPDGRFLIASVYATYPSQSLTCKLVLFSAESGMRVRQIAPGGAVAALSADGHTLAYSDGNAVKLLKLTPDYRPTGPPATLAQEPRAISAINWLPSGKELVYQTWGDVPYLRRIGLQPGARPQPIPAFDNELSIAQILPDGSVLATETTQVNALWRADLRSMPAKLETVADPGCSAREPNCSPDGLQRVIITAPTGIYEIRISNTDGTNERPLVRPIPSFANPTDDGFPTSVLWSPDGKWIAFTVAPRQGNSDIRSDLYVIPPSGGTPRRLGEEAYSLIHPTWSLDGQSLYATREWSIEDKGHDRESPIVRIDVATGTFSPTGADGIWPKLSPNGKFIYFFTWPSPKLSRTRLPDGPAEVFGENANLLWGVATIGTQFVYLFQNLPRNAAKLNTALVRFDPETRQSVRLAEGPFQPKLAFLSRDEHFLYFDQTENSQSRVVFVRGLL